MNMKKPITSLLTIGLLFTLIIPVQQTKAGTKNYIDVKDHPYEKELLYAIESGIMKNTHNKMYPDKALTKGAVCRTLNFLIGATEKYDMSKVTNLKLGDKYYNTVAIGLQTGYLVHKPDKSVYNPLGRATYQYIADVFSKALGRDMKIEIMSVFAGKSNTDTLTRAEYAVILAEITPDVLLLLKKNRLQSIHKNRHKMSIQ